MKLTRRVFLTAGLASVCACSLPYFSTNPSVEEPRGPKCRVPESLIEMATIAGAPLTYEVNHKRFTPQADRTFRNQIESWCDDWASLSGYGAVTGISSYGAYVDKCGSWHQAGRAFDIASIRHATGQVSCRYDLWKPGTAQQRRDYWRLAASIALHFTYTLTHHFDAYHANHIHFDNGIEGGHTTFNPESRVANQLVQASLTHVHGIPTPITGTWDDATKTSLRKAQHRYGITVPLREPEGWRAYLRATAKGHR